MLCSRVVGLALVLATAAGCTASEFTCSSDEQCVRGSAIGFCERTGFCSFADPACTDSGRTYGPFSGALSDTCVAGFPLVVEATGDGRVTSSPAGIDCPARCSAVFDAGASVQLAATPDLRRYPSWGPAGECHGTATDCAVVMDQRRSVTATFRAANYVFVTSTEQNPGELGGLAGADVRCNELAGAAGLPGTYRAWLSTTAGINAIDRIAQARGWIRRDGRPVVDSLADITNGRFFYPIRIDEAGHDVGGALVATGTIANGTNGGTPTAGDWMDKTQGARCGFADAGRDDWTEAAGLSVCRSARIYCFGIDLVSDEIVVEKPDARIAFLLGKVGSNPPTTFFPQGGGVMAADTACGDLAGDLPGAYRALIATTGQSAVERFDTSKLPWARPDGVLVVASAADLATGTLLAPIDVFPDRVTYGGGNLVAWMGAATPSQPAAAKTDTCTDWTDPATTGLPVIGRPVRSADAAFVLTTSQFLCSNPNNNGRLYCLQQ